MPQDAPATITLDWPNKHRQLLTSGLTGYAWADAAPDSLPQLRLLVRDPVAATGNILVIGDGLDAIKGIEQTPALDSGIRLVYLDPPFNTQKTFAQYVDALDRPMWLSMFRDRLLALVPHLRADASVWVHLDDAEVHRARAVMDEVFGEGGFVASVIWQKRTSRDSRAAFSSSHDTILVYAPRGPRFWKRGRNPLPNDLAAARNRDDDPRGPWTDAPFTAPGYRPAQQYELVTPSGRVLTPPRGRSWYATEPRYRQFLAEGRIWFPKAGDGSPRLKLFAEHAGGLVPFTLWPSSEVGTNDDAKRHLQALFPDGTVFDTPKPESLLARILHLASDPGDLVVDLFAGSGTTAAVAQKMGRRWITVERNPQTVAEFTKPRLDAVLAGRDPGGTRAAAPADEKAPYTLAAVDPQLGPATVLPPELSPALAQAIPA